jgi:hypothetical protein
MLILYYYLVYYFGCILFNLFYRRILLELYTNNFGDNGLKRNYIWGFANEKGLNTTALEYRTTDKVWRNTHESRLFYVFVTYVWILSVSVRHEVNVHNFANVFGTGEWHFKSSVLVLWRLPGSVITAVFTRCVDMPVLPCAFTVWSVQSLVNQLALCLSHSIVFEPQLSSIFQNSGLEWWR